MSKEAKIAQAKAEAEAKVAKAKADQQAKVNAYAEHTALLSGFQASVAAAKASGDAWVETDPEVIKVLQPNGLGGAKYFIYQGIKVCEYGMSEEIEAETNVPIGVRMHGQHEGKLENKS